MSFLRPLLLPALLLSSLASGLPASGEKQLRVWIEPGRDRWFTSPVSLSLTLQGLDAEALKHVDARTFKIEVDGQDLTQAFLAAVSSYGKVEVKDGGRTLKLSVRAPLAPGEHRIRVSYQVPSGGGPVFRQAFRIYDPDQVLRSLGFPPRRGRVPSLGIHGITTPSVPPQAAPVFLKPADLAFVHQGSADLSVQWVRNGAGMDLAALKILLDNQDVTSKFTMGQGQAVLKGHPLKNGKHTLVAQAVDRDGRLRVESATFIVFDGSKRLPWIYAPTTKAPVLGHTHHQFQWYGGGTNYAYFHHGVDIHNAWPPQVIKVYTARGGRITSFYWYGGKPYYFEVGITDDDGFVWQYHHVDRNTVPASIVTLASQKGRVSGGVEIGSTVYWPVPSYGYRFHHIHLNLLAPDGRYMNPLNFMLPIPDKVPPKVHAVYLTQNGGTTVLNPNGGSGATVSGKLDFHARAEDLIGTFPYQLTVYKMTWELLELTGTKSHHVPETPLWTFDFLPGGGNRNAQVWDIFDYRLMDGFNTLYTRGNYSARIFYYNLTSSASGRLDPPRGFFDSAKTLFGKRLFPNGDYQLTVRAYDRAGNVGSRVITFKILN